MVGLVHREEHLEGIEQVKEVGCLAYLSSKELAVQRTSL